MVYYFYIIYSLVHATYMLAWWKVKMNGPPVIKYVSCERYDGIHELYKLSSGANGTLTCFCTLKPLNLILCESIYNKQICMQFTFH